MSDTLIIWAVGLTLSLVAVLPFLLKRRKIEQQTEKAELYALQYGLKEPASLHPVVNPEACIGIGNCLKVCPEHDVLGLRNGQAVAVSPARCIGHGLCERACPVDAITLVFGTEKRGVEIPRVKENFETNVDGIYIVGELGGMGLIRNAFEQGRQCIDSIIKERRTVPKDALDLLIVGCGPGGLSASLNALHRGLNFVTIEKELDIGGTVRHYPRKKLVMTSPFEVPGYGKIKFREIEKEGLVELWSDMVGQAGLDVNLNETVQSVIRTKDDCFEVRTSKGQYKTRRVILAIGRRGIPRKLDIPGEDQNKVAYSLREPDHFKGDRIVVVGGGDSAIEAALALADQPGNEVSISYRKDQFSRIKPGNFERVTHAVESQRIDILWSTNLTAIEKTHIIYEDATGEQFRCENDHVFIFVGGELPTKFLQNCGIAIDTKFGMP